jgi:hypothetical protein
MMSGNQKITILLSLLNERYNSSHQMRDRSLKFAMWVIGFVIIAIPWLLLNRDILTNCIKLSFTIIILLIGLFLYWFLIAIHIGFNRNWDIIAKIEKALGCYETSFYIEEEQLFPKEFQYECKKKKKINWTYHFVTIYAWVAIAMAIIIFFIWFNPS